MEKSDPEPCGCVEHQKQRDAYQRGKLEGQQQVLQTLANGLRKRGDEAGARVVEQMAGLRETH